MGEANRKRTIEERKADEKKREDAGFKIFESYIRAIISFYHDPSAEVNTIMTENRDRFREFIKHAE